MRSTSVVRIFTTSLDPDYDNPWQTASPSGSTGSGVIVGPRRVLTGAHVVANATFIRVQNSTNPEKYVAEVLGVCHDADLALLEVEDPAFMDGVEVAALGGLPSLRDKVSVVGFPVGGEELSVTEGVVSRIEMQRYSHSDRRALAVTVDAAINSGNSGGPVFLGDKVVGVAFQSLDDAENIGEMVPASLVKRFLSGIEAGKPLSLPALGVRTQTLENPTLRRSLQMPEGVTGVLVRAIAHGSSADGVLKTGDAMLEIDGYPIANTGTIQYLGRHRTSYPVILGEHFEGEEIPVVVLRDGQRLEVTLPLKARCPLVPLSQYDVRPTYLIYAGLVFQPLTANFLRTWDKWWNSAPKEFLYHFYFGVPTPDRTEVVALSQVLADQINVGYQGLYEESIVEVNGHAPRNMLDFVRRVDAAEGTLRLRTSTDSLIVLDVDAAREVGPRVLQRYRVAADRSADLTA